MKRKQKGLAAKEVEEAYKLNEQNVFDRWYDALP
jgi:hypothetical protein